MSRIDEIIPMVDLPEAEVGDWKIVKFDAEDSVIARMRERHFRPGTYTQLLHKSRGLIMSDTPAERYDHLEFVQAAKGDVLISGLGLGMCLGAVLKKPEVTSVTVIEISPDVIKMVAPHYADERVMIIEGDIRDWRPKKGVRFGAVWHDIWDNIYEDNLPEMATLNRRYAQKADWKGCWSQGLIRAYA